MRTARATWRMAAAAAAFLMASAAGLSAHDVEKGPNGGQMLQAKAFHLELTTRDGAVAIYLSDEAHAAVASAGASGKIVILDGSRQSTVELTPADPNVLVAKLDGQLPAGAKVVVSAKLRGGQDVLARFVVK